MNERIRELALQAGWMMGDEVDGFTTRLEKFTELIVRECALTAGLMEHQGRKNIGAQILDNFGIKDNE
jgi:hypothetical protein